MFQRYIKTGLAYAAITGMLLGSALVEANELNKGESFPSSGRMIKLLHSFYGNGGGPTIDELWTGIPLTHETTCNGVDLQPAVSTPLNRYLGDETVAFVVRDAKAQGDPNDGNTTTELEVMEGCLGDFGTRYLVRFPSSIANSGTVDFDIGNPFNPNPPYENLFLYYPPHGHLHADLYYFRLVDPYSNEEIIGRKYSIATVDTSPMSFQSFATGPNFFGHIWGDGDGISSGWYDDYPIMLPCQYLDITGIPAGDYILEIVVDNDNQVPECDETNNVLSIPITVPEQMRSNYKHDRSAEWTEYDLRLQERLFGVEL